MQDLIIGQDRHGPMWSKNGVSKYVCAEVLMGTHVPRREKSVTTEINTATDVIVETTDRFSKALDVLVTKQAEIVDSSKKASGNVRKAADDLASGLLKVQKAADFNSLERYVTLLERAASAMTTLSELDKTGKLSRLVQAMK